jgi:hypothetical protein
MPADVSYSHVATRADAKPASRPLPLGFGLLIAAAASVGLWVGVAVGVKALFF